MSALKSAKNKVTKAIKTAKKNFFHESFRENENNRKKILSALKALSCKQSTRGLTYLEENKTTRIKDNVSIAEVLNKHFTGLAESLADKTATQFNSKTLKSFVSKCNTSNVKHAFPTITPDQTKNLIEAIPSGKATGTDGVSARILKIAAPAIAPSLAKLRYKSVVLSTPLKLLIPHLRHFLPFIHFLLNYSNYYKLFRSFSEPNY